MSEPQLSRRRVLQTALSLGGSLAAASCRLAPPVEVEAAPDGAHTPTPEQIMGPFYPVSRPLDRDADLTVVDGQSGRAKGQVIHVVGRVLNHQGEPVPGARLEIWQANTFGRYAHASDRNTAPLDPSFQGYGAIESDAEGRYRFKSIKPGAYSVGAGDAVRPPHIHFDIHGQHDRLVTQMYFPGDPRNDGDSIFAALGRRQAAATARVLAPTEDMEADAQLLVWDVVLDRG